MTQVSERLSLEEFRAIPEQKPYLEFWNGEIVQKMSPQRNHWKLQQRLAVLFEAYRQTAGGEAGPETSIFFDNPGDQRELIPDFAYWAPGKPAGETVGLPPTLAVEIRSAGQSLPFLRNKCRYYIANGVDVAWLVDPQARTVEVFEEGRDGLVLINDSHLESPTLPGLRIELAELFSALDE